MKELTLHLEEERLSLQDQRDQVTREQHAHTVLQGAEGASHIPAGVMGTVALFRDPDQFRIN